jgi:P27 family predicted phage terminase small subunit
MPGGRPPKPIELKRRTGNPGKRPLPEPKRRAPGAYKAPTPPAGLGLAGKQAWARLWSAGQVWLSPTADWDLLVMYCQAQDERAEYVRSIREDGLWKTRFVTSRDGNSWEEQYPNEAVAALRKLEPNVTRWLSLLGFSPSDRARIGVSEARPEPDALADFLADRPAV